MTRGDLEKELRDNLKKGIKPNPDKSLEESLKKTLERTTPEQPGDPRDTVDRLKQAEWL